MNFLGKKINSIWFPLGNVMLALSSMIKLAMISNVVDVAAAGEFGVSYAIAMLLFKVGLFGVNFYQMTDYEKKYSFSDYFTAKVVTSILMAVFCFFTILFFSGSLTRILYLSLLCLFVMVNSIAELYQSLFFQENRLVIIGRALFFRTVLCLVVFSAVLIITGDVVSALIWLNVVNVVAISLLLVPSRIFLTKTDYRFSRNAFHLLFVRCLPICISTFLMTLMLNASKYVIDFQGDADMQGVFNILFIPVAGINLLSGFMFKPMLIKYSEYITKSELGSFYKLFFRQVALIAGLTFAGVLGGWLLGPPILSFIFGVDLSGFGTTIAIIVTGGGLLAFSALLYYILLIFRVQKFILAGYFVCSIVAIILGAVTISGFGIYGASLSFLTSYLLLSVFFVIVMRRKVRGRGLGYRI